MVKLNAHLFETLVNFIFAQSKDTNFYVVISLLFSFCQSTSSALCSNKTSLRIRSVNVYRIKLVAFMNYGNSFDPEASLSLVDNFVIFAPNNTTKGLSNTLHRLKKDKLNF